MLEIYYKTLLYKKNKKAYNSFIIYLIKEGKKTENKDKKNITRKKIINYVLNNHVTSKAGIAKELNLSMPTVLANVNDLLEKKGVGRNWGICFNRWKEGKKYRD